MASFIINYTFSDGVFEPFFSSFLLGLRICGSLIRFTAHFNVFYLLIC